jgi:hypothetical protein
MRIAFSAGTIVFALAAAALIAGYRVTEADVAESRLAVRRNAGAAPGPS